MSAKALAPSRSTGTFCFFTFSMASVRLSKVRSDRIMAPIFFAKISESLLGKVRFSSGFGTITEGFL